jgi:ssRNA-specific RNase YbeY (16S rRNA maturation enzyme)
MEISLDLARRCLESTWHIPSNVASIEVSDRVGKIWLTSSKSLVGHMHVCMETAVYENQKYKLPVQKILQYLVIHQN